MPLQGSNRHIKPTSFLSISSFIQTLYIHTHRCMFIQHIYKQKQRDGWENGNMDETNGGGV